MKYLYALEIADSWATLPAHPTREQIAGLLSQGIHFSTHSRLTDLMDAISQLRESYKQRWLDQYTGYRLNTALGRWDAEYEYWRRTQATFGEMSSGFQDNSALPPLDQLAGYPAK